MRIGQHDNKMDTPHLPTYVNYEFQSLLMHAVAEVEFDVPPWRQGLRRKRHYDEHGSTPLAGTALKGRGTTGQNRMPPARAEYGANTGDAGTGRRQDQSRSRARRLTHGMVERAHAASAIRELQFFGASLQTSRLLGRQ